MTRFSVHEQITRLVCVEGWSAIAWWAGLRFDDLLRAYQPMSQAKWARVESSVNLDNSGNPDPYFMSIDLATARHPQTLLATHFNGQPLTVDHGAPLRLLVPVKLGLKNVKAITRNYLFRGGAKRLLGRTRVFPLRRNLAPHHTQLATVLAQIYFYYIFESVLTHTKVVARCETHVNIGCLVDGSERCEPTMYFFKVPVLLPANCVELFSVTGMDANQVAPSARLWRFPPVPA